MSCHLLKDCSKREAQIMCFFAWSGDIEQVVEANLLGVTIDEALSWATHINNLITKMSRSFSIIRGSAYFLTNTARKQVLQSLVLSHLEYCPAIWSNAPKQELNKIQLTQNRAARLYCIHFPCSANTLLSYTD